MTRAEAIEILERVDICANAAETARDMAIAALKEQDVTDINVGNKWISVKERLPEVGLRVLVCSPYDLQNIGLHLGGGRWKIKTAYPDTPTHWMQLSTPPKGDAE